MRNLYLKARNLNVHFLYQLQTLSFEASTFRLLRIDFAVFYILSIERLAAFNEYQ